VTSIASDSSPTEAEPHQRCLAFPVVCPTCIELLQVVGDRDLKCGNCERMWTGVEVNPCSRQATEPVPGDHDQSPQLCGPHAAAWVRIDAQLSAGPTALLEAGFGLGPTVRQPANRGGDA
jgi:hypothetical protein